MSSSSRQSRPAGDFFSQRRRSTINGLPGYVWIPAVATGGVLVYGYFAFLDEVPLTKRKRWIATSPEWERRLGDQEYKQLLQQFRGQVLPPDHRASMTVKRVGSRIAAASKDFCREQNLISSQKAYTFTVVRSDQANAFVLPNNHVFVLTGLFKYVRDEDELAAVLGHEMAHNLARHAGERMSGGIVVNILARLLFLFDPSGVLTTIFLPAANLVSTLPHSREAESEADRIGIHLASKACYDPRAAKRVFAAMKEGTTVSGQRAPPEFMSTHPSHDRRISQFDDWMPEALESYRHDRCSNVRHEMAHARRQAALAATMREQKAKQSTANNNQTNNYDYQ